MEAVRYDVDAVILFTGRTGTYVGFDEPESFIKVNELGLLNVLNAMRKADSTAKLVFPSTRLVYKGKDEILSEDAEKEMKTVYAVNKFACEQYLKMYHEVFGIHYCIFRICVPYGSLLKGVSSYGTAEFFIGKAAAGENISLYGDGEVRRTLTYIGDLCRTMALATADRYGVDVEYTPWPESALKIESGRTVFDSTKLDAILGSIRRMSFKRWIGGGE